MLLHKNTCVYRIKVIFLYKYHQNRRNGTIVQNKYINLQIMQEGIPSNFHRCVKENFALLGCCTTSILEEWTDRLSLNFGNYLPITAAWHRRRAKILYMKPAAVSHRNKQRWREWKCKSQSDHKIFMKFPCILEFRVLDVFRITSIKTLTKSIITL